MSLSGAGLAALIKTNLEGESWVRAGSPELDEFCSDIGNAVVDYLVANAVVLPTLLVAPSGGGPVTGSGVIE